MPDVELIAEVLDPDHRLGWHRHHADANRAHPVAATLASLDVVAKKWPGPSRPLNQGQVGSCTGNASTRACAHTVTRVTGVRYTETLAVKTYELATTLDGVPGTYPPTDTGSTTVAALAACKAERLIGSYKWAFSFAEALATIAQVGPVITGVNWYSGFDHPTSTGLLVLSGSVRGGHELCIDQVIPDSTADGGGLVGGWNSWGPDWGPIRGRFYWTWATWQRLLSEGGEVGVGLRS